MCFRSILSILFNVLSNCPNIPKAYFLRYDKEVVSRPSTSFHDFENTGVRNPAVSLAQAPECLTPDDEATINFQSTALPSTLTSPSLPKSQQIDMPADHDKCVDINAVEDAMQQSKTQYEDGKSEIVS